MNNAIKAFTDAGGIVITAAGNGGVDATSTYPCNLSQTNTQVICVAAHDANNQLTIFSNYGNSVNISAPGENIWSTIKSNTYDNMRGTSMASPHVAGAFSLLRTYRTDLSVADIRQALYSGADTTLTAYPGK
jgi:subtilisin family serine protease